MGNMSRGVLLVTRNFPPVLGGMERLMHHVYLELERGFEVTLLGPQGCENYARPGLRVFTCPLSPIAIFLSCLQWRAYRIARETRPDLVIAGSGVAAPAALCAARSIGKPVICYLHGLDLVARDPVYQRMFIPLIRRCDRFIVNSRNTARLAREIDIASSSIEILHPGVAMPAANSPVGSSSFREKLNAERKVIMLSVGRIHPRKGLPRFIEQAMPLLVEKIPNLVLVLIGEEPQKALRSSGDELQRVLAAAKSIGLEKHVTTLGAVDDATLAMAYRESDLLIFPVLDLPGDVEGFGMVAVEAAAHGLPTVAFAEGGVPDAIKEGVSGYLVSPGDYVGFAGAVIRCLDEKSTGWRDRCIEHARDFSWDIFGEKLRKICRDAIDAARGERVSG